MAGKLFNALNYLVPATGSVRSWQIKQNFTDNPASIDWQQIGNDAGEGVVRFIPSGVFVDNRTGTTPVIIRIVEMDFTIAIAAGAQKQAQYPAPVAQNVEITGGDSPDTCVIFVDFPVIPFESLGDGGIQLVNINQGYDTDGDALPIGFNTLPQVFTYIAPGQVETIAVTDGVNTWTQTLTYSGTDVDTISGWVKT